jgi:protein-disulfide isomerase-like protein with CxxC motif
VIDSALRDAIADELQKLSGLVDFTQTVFGSAIGAADFWIDSRAALESWEARHRYNPPQHLPLLETVQRWVYDQLHGTDFSTPEITTLGSLGQGLLKTVATYKPFPPEGV